MISLLAGFQKQALCYYALRLLRLSLRHCTTAHVEKTAKKNRFSSSNGSVSCLHVDELDVVHAAVCDGLIDLLVLPDSLLEVLQSLQQTEGNP